MCSSLKLLYSVVPAFLKACKNGNVDAELKAYLLGQKNGAECLFFLSSCVGLNTFGCVVAICGRFNPYKCFDTTHFMNI